MRMKLKEKKSKSIRRRWMLNSIGAVFLIVLLAVAAFSVALTGYYYSTMSSSTISRVSTAVPFFNDTTQSGYYQMANNYINDIFDEADHLELQFLNTDGSIRLTSYGLKAGTYPGTPDIESALSGSSGEPTAWSGRDPSTGEHILAVSCAIRYDGQVVGVIRMVTSLSLVDRQIILIIGMALAVGAAILALVYFSNLYFVRSIVEPVSRIAETAKRIAAGSYGIQIEKKYDDEIGDLTDTINDMSQKIKEAEKMKNEFISSVSHELRTPLTAIKGWAETLMNSADRSSADAQKGMGIIVSEARRLTNMVEELLEFSRIQDGRFNLSIEPVDIKAEFEDAVYTYQEFFRKEGIILRYQDCPEEFPLIPADPERLRQVFSNLLDNAGKHGGSGGRIDTAIRPEGEDKVAIVIRDYGPGIPEEELPHVKTKFYKGSSKARGSGIGLAVCEEIVTRHNGELRIGNAEGGGCEVTICLPIGT